MELAQTEDSEDTLYDNPCILECFRAASEDLRFRIGHRDHWVNTQLIAQATVFALSQGIGFGNVKATGPVVYAAFLALPIAAILAAFYVVQDRAVGHIIDYLRALSIREPDSISSRCQIPNFYGSPHFAGFRTTIGIRSVSHVLAFIVVPITIMVFALPQLRTWGITEFSGVFANAILLLYVARVFLQEAKFRVSLFAAVQVPTERSKQAIQGDNASTTHSPCS